MRVIAVAGCTGDLGRTIVEQLVGSGKFKVFILSRKSTVSPISGSEVLVVDYSNVDTLAATLDEQSVDTVVSTLGPAGAKVQLDLIAAADKALSTTRFIPSEFASYIPPDATDDFTVDVRHAAEELRKTGLQFTRFSNGIFMDYYGFPHIPTHLRNFVWGVDVAGHQAAIPGSGDDILSMTYSKDVARYVERILDDEEWPEYSIVCGSDITFNQLLSLAKQYTGHEFNVTYDNAEKLRQGDATVLSPESGYAGVDPKVISSMVGQQLMEGELALPKEGRLNDRYPEIKPLSVEDLLAKAWSDA